MVKINPPYLWDYRSRHGIEPDELRYLKAADEKTWLRLKDKLRKLTKEEKLQLLKREWDKSHLGEYDIPKAVEKHFLDELSNKKILSIK
jgi:hypothetical protein